MKLPQVEFELKLQGKRVHSGYGREKDTSVTEINGNGNKTMKTNQISKKAKQGQAILKNGMRPTKKTKKKKKIPFLRLKSESGVPNTTKLGGTLIFWFTNKKTVFKKGIPNKTYVFGCFQDQFLRKICNKLVNKETPNYWS
jgi:hypothetical protein